VEGEDTSKADAGRLSDFTAMGLRVMLLVLNLLTICSLVASSPGRSVRGCCNGWVGIMSSTRSTRFWAIGGWTRGRGLESRTALVGLTSVANHSVGVVRA
jgi:hypothetical protein